MPAKTRLPPAGKAPGHTDSASYVLDPQSAIPNPQSAIRSPHLLIPRRKVLITLDFRPSENHLKKFLTRKKGGVISQL
jgi:hypothetical protein